MIVTVTDRIGEYVYHARVFATRTLFTHTSMPYFRKPLFDSIVNNQGSAVVPDTPLNVFLRIQAVPFLEQEIVTEGGRELVEVVLDVDPLYEGVEGYGWAFYGRKKREQQYRIKLKLIPQITGSIILDTWNDK